VLDTDSKGDRASALPVLQPMLDDVTDQRVGIHAAFELTDDVVALLRAHASEIWIHWRIDARLD